jgi:hypothetical protein
VADTSNYDRLAVEWMSERNRAARDARYRTNVEFAICQARCLAALVLAVIAVATGGPRLVVAVVEALTPSDRHVRITSPADSDPPCFVSAGRRQGKVCR